MGTGRLAGPVRSALAFYRDLGLPGVAPEQAERLMALLAEGRPVGERERSRKAPEVAVSHAPPRRPSPPVVGEIRRLETSEREASLRRLRAEIGDCIRCPLSAGRTNVVFGVGSAHAALMFVGEGPGADEDTRGLPFVGRAGELLTRMIEAMGTTRDDVYIANIVKCRPPGNRDPQPDEVGTCFPFLVRQIEIIRPSVIVTLGRVAAQSLLETLDPIGKIRGRFQEFRGIPVMPTYHPAYLLRSPGQKKPAWEDLKQVIARLGWEMPPR